MKLFLYGNFEVKILEKISEITLKNNFSKIEYSLSLENISEILSGLSSISLFGEKNLFVIDISESELEELEEFLKAIPTDSELILICKRELEKSSKILKLIPKEFTFFEFNQSKGGNTFLFTDLLMSKDLTKTYIELNKLTENKILIFNNIVSMTRSLLGLKYDLDLKNKIIPFKVSLFKKNVEKYSVEELKNIFNNLCKNDLRFKKGEINEDMLLLHSINLFFDNKNGNSK